MKLNIVVLAKQVPDTRNVGKDAMTAEGTVNRAALPAIFNPEDLNALEQALRLKDLDPENVHVGVVTMGPAPERSCARASIVVPTRAGSSPTARALVPILSPLPISSQRPLRK